MDPEYTMYLAHKNKPYYCGFVSDAAIKHPDQ